MRKKKKKKLSPNGFSLNFFLLPIQLGVIFVLAKLNLYSFFFTVLV